MTVTRIIARLAYETGRDLFKDAPKRTMGGSSDRKTLRLKNLQPDEIEVLIAIWQDEREADNLGRVQLILAADTDVECDSRFRAEPDKSITWYRNYAEDGLWYVQTKIESDEQGLESIFTIQDRNYLDGSLVSGDGFDPAERAIQIAWAEAGGDPGGLPRLLAEQIAIVGRSLQNSEISIPIRMFAKFALEAAENLIRTGSQVFDPVDVRLAVGGALTALGLLPDEGWESDGTVARRLLVNYRLSDLMDSNGTVDQDPDELADRISEVAFTDQDGEPLTLSDSNAWRDRCLDFVRERSEASRKRLPFWVYRQVFSKDRVRGALGDRVREEILLKDASRILEFDVLDVKESLNRNEQEAARKFVEALPDDDSKQALFDLLTLPPQKALKKLAYPRDRRFTNPFTLIIEILKKLDDEVPVGTVLEIRCGRMDQGAPHGDPSVGLFSFLYGHCLAELVEQSASDSSGVRLLVDEHLLHVQLPPTLRSESAEDGESEDVTDLPTSVEWEGVPLEVSLRKHGETETALLSESVRWEPSDIDWLAFGWIMVAAADAPLKNPILELSSGTFGSLIESVIARVVPIEDLLLTKGNTTHNGELDGTAQRLEEVRADFWTLTTAQGLKLTVMSEYVDVWTALLAESVGSFVPNGVLDPRLEMLLSTDVIQNPSASRALMLWSHPLRLRWLNDYLREAMRLCAGALAGDLRLNSVNESFYLSALEGFSPHGLPPLLANSARTLMVPVGERGFSEEFAAIERDGDVSNTWKADLDDSAISEVAKQVGSYLRTHPHKADGLSLIFVLPAGGIVPQNLIELIRKSEEWKALPIYCVVVAPRESWDGIVKKFEKLETESRVGGVEQISPPLQLELLDWTGEADAAKALAGRECDIAVVPNFFGDRVDVREYSEAPQDRPGVMHVLHDDCTYPDRESDPGSVSIVLRPEAPDQALDNWSTANVRLFRSAAVSPNAPQNVDYVKLNIRFDEAGILFAALHDSSHWVVTLDRYIGRQQIESLPKSPDVLTVKEAVGQSGLLTLVVSSNAGRKFVVQRLSRKLQHICDSIPELDSEALAESVYDEIRVVAPGLILRSMGISRITEEVLGLMVAKRISEHLIPAPSNSSVWISLDEHTEWFGGDNTVRADLCRVDLFRVGGRLQLGLVVVEGKLRQTYDSHGEQQAARTAQLLREALSTSGLDDGGGFADASFWRRVILAATRDATDNASVSVMDESVFEDVTKTDFLAGDYDLAYCQALYSICIYEKQTPLVQNEIDGVTVIQSSASAILDLIEGKLDALPRMDLQTRETLDGEGPEQNGGAGHLDESLETPSEEATAGQTATAGGVSASDAEPIDTEGAADQRKRMPDEKLKTHYQTIIDTLTDFKVDVRRPDDGKPLFIEGPAFVQFRVRTGRGVHPNKIIACDAPLRLALAMDEGKALRFQIGGGTVNVEFPKEDADRYYVSASGLWQRWGGPPGDCLAVPLGVNQRDEVVEINFSLPNSPHLLIGGTTGSGKSEALNTILHGLTRHYTSDQLKLVLVDPKRTEMAAFEESPHLLGNLTFDAQAAVAVLDDAVHEMDRRYKLFESQRVRDLPKYNSAVAPEQRIPWHAIVLDEYADLVSEPADRREIEQRVLRLAAKARAAGIHLIIATQKPSAESINTTIRSNLPAQLALRCSGAIESRIIIGEAGAETLNGKGDAFLKIADRIERVQCAMV